MTAIHFLQQYGEAVRRIRLIEIELEEEQLLIDAVRSLSDNDGMPRGSGISKPTENKAVRLADKRERLIKAKNAALEIRQEVFDVIMEVGGFESDVLYERYINLRTWDRVCEAVIYSWPTVRSAWHRGLDRVNEIINT